MHPSQRSTLAHVSCTADAISGMPPCSAGVSDTTSTGTATPLPGHAPTDRHASIRSMQHGCCSASRGVMPTFTATRSVGALPAPFDIAGHGGCSDVAMHVRLRGGNSSAQSTRYASYSGDTDSHTDGILAVYGIKDDERWQPGSGAVGTCKAADPGHNRWTQGATIPAGTPYMLVPRRSDRRGWFKQLKWFLREDSNPVGTAAATEGVSHRHRQCCNTTATDGAPTCTLSVCWPIGPCYCVQALKASTSLTCTLGMR